VHPSSSRSAWARRLVLGAVTLLAAGGALAEGAAAAAPGREPPAAASLAADAAHDAAHQRWKRALDAFDAADKAQPLAPGGVLFVGSSSIRMWSHLAQDFPALPVVINRGFGGSTMADCELLVRELVLPHQPRHVLVYAGDNDLAEGRMPLQVLRSFAQFARAVRAALPQARISFIAIKPSPSREALMPRIRETNDIVAAYLRTQANADYIDVFTPMMGADGHPRAELFLPDRLHMNAAGYRIWHDVIAAHVAADAPAPQRAAAGPAPTP
jgi:lysophospholipase L1-like esterase